MEESRNQHQIIRKDNKNCFVESLSDAFEIGKSAPRFCYIRSKQACREPSDQLRPYLHQHSGMAGAVPEVSLRGASVSLAGTKKGR